MVIVKTNETCKYPLLYYINENIFKRIEIKMRIKVSDIGESGLHIATFRKPEWLSNVPELASDDGDIHLSSNLNFDLHLVKILKEITVRGKAWFSIEAPCARCLRDVDLILTPEVKLTLLPEHIPHEVDGDIGFEAYTGDEIDLGGYLRETVAMSLPLKVLCQEDCKGLCPHCGADLNLGACSCKDDWVDPRFTALRNLRF